MSNDVDNIADPLSSGLKPTPTARDFEHYRRLARQRPISEADLQIGSSGVARRIWRLIGWAMLFAAVASLFVVLFYHFTNNLRVALIVVGAMGVYMFFASRLAEGRFDRRND